MRGKGGQGPPPWETLRLARKTAHPRAPAHAWGARYRWNHIPTDMEMKFVPKAWELGELAQPEPGPLLHV